MIPRRRRVPERTKQLSASVSNCRRFLSVSSSVSLEVPSAYDAAQAHISCPSQARRANLRRHDSSKARNACNARRHVGDAPYHGGGYGMCLALPSGGVFGIQAGMASPPLIMPECGGYGVTHHRECGGVRLIGAYVRGGSLTAVSRPTSRSQPLTCCCSGSNTRRPPRAPPCPIGPRPSPRGTCGRGRLGMPFNSPARRPSSSSLVTDERQGSCSRANA
jgi:hypothetical protein